MNERRDHDRSSSPSRESRPRSSAADLEQELVAIERTLPPPERRVSRPAESRRSVPELMAELERLSADIPLRRSSSPAPIAPPRAVPTVVEAAVPSAPAVPESAPAKPSIPPARADFDDVPAVLGILDPDGIVRSAITPPAPATPSMRPARRPSIPPPIPEAARRMSIPAPIAPTPVANEDSTMMMQLDASLLEEIDAADVEDVAEESMREPTPAPIQLEDGTFAIPRAPALPDRGRAKHDSLPDLSDLGAMLEPSAEPPEPPSTDTDRPVPEQDES